jgi:hypothetical protein
MGILNKTAREHQLNTDNVVDIGVGSIYIPGEKLTLTMEQTFV